MPGSARSRPAAGCRSRKDLPQRRRVTEKTFFLSFPFEGVGEMDAPKSSNTSSTKTTPWFGTTWDTWLPCLMHWRFLFLSRKR